MVIGGPIDGLQPVATAGLQGRAWQTAAKPDSCSGSRREIIVRMISATSCHPL
jgi:hypothetical protein